MSERMDEKAKGYIEELLKVLGQMEHYRGLEGKMIMSVKDRQRLISEGSELVGLFPVKHPYPQKIVEMESDKDYAIRLKAATVLGEYFRREAIAEADSEGLNVILTFLGLPRRPIDQ